MRQSTAADSDQAGLATQKTIFHRAATFCLASPLLAIGANLAAPLAGEFFLWLGMIAGVFALCGMAWHGTKGILTKAVMGLVIHMLLIVSAIYTRGKVEEMARKIIEESAEKQK